MQALIDDMFARELSADGRAARNYRALASVRRKVFDLHGLPLELRFNPDRVKSVMAEVDELSLSQRPCFLCPDGLEQHQLTTLWTAPAPSNEEADHQAHAHTYAFRVNPYPIFDRHLTISALEHTRQQIDGRLTDMLCIARLINRYTLFYNGPHCGASAPDHMHFQAIPRHQLPIEQTTDWDEIAPGISVHRFFESGAVRLRSTSPTLLVSTITRLLSRATTPAHEWEPRINLLCFCDKPESAPLEQEPHSSVQEPLNTSVQEPLNTSVQEPNTLEQEPHSSVQEPLDTSVQEPLNTSVQEPLYTAILFFRRESRPHQFFLPESERILFSPATVEMAGIGIVADERSFERIDQDLLTDMLAEVSLPRHDLEQLVLFP